MADTTVTMRLPDTLYARLKHQAEQTHRTLEEAAVDALAAALPLDDRLPDDLEAAIAALATLDDEALWQAAHARLSDAEIERSEFLHLTHQRDGLTHGEASNAAALAATYDRAMVVRAQAAVLLKQRGYDIGTLIVSA